MALVVTHHNRTKIVFDGDQFTGKASKPKTIIGKAIACGLIALIVLQIALPIAANFSL